MKQILRLVACMMSAPIYLLGQSLGEALIWSRQEVQQARQELNEGRDKIVEEKLPLAGEMRELRERLQVQEEALRLLEVKRENRDLELQGLKNEHQEGVGLAQNLSNSVGRFRQEFETGLVHGERNRYADTLLNLDEAQRGEGEGLLKRAEAQLKFLELSLDRLESLFGGSRFTTEAISEFGAVEKGDALAYGPIVLFNAKSGGAAGNLFLNYSGILAEVQTLDDSHQSDIQKLFDEGESIVRIDPTLGQATLISDDPVTIVEHLKQGGFWMVPIGLFGAGAFVVSVLKWIRLRKVNIPGVSEFEQLQTNQPVEWEMRYEGESRHLLEKMLAASGENTEIRAAELDVAYQEFRFKLNRWLPIIALTAAVSPLLGLLGTVTGMIKTFQLISIFGAGDAKLLSSGISEALITTEFGLVVAIPALVLHAYLQRRIKKILIQSAGLLEQISSRYSSNNSFG